MPSRKKANSGSVARNTHPVINARQDRVINVQPNVQPTPIRAKLNNRFYEPLVLLITLNNTWANQRRARIPSQIIDTTLSAEDRFHNFVNKLSQLCDWECGGKTVTALVVLQHPSHVEYRFASNQRSAQELKAVKSFVEQLLGALHNNSDNCSPERVSDILCLVLPFLRSRIDVYARNLKRNLGECMSACTRGGFDGGKSILLVGTNEADDMIKLNCCLESSQQSALRYRLCRSMRKNENVSLQHVMLLHQSLIFASYSPMREAVR